jgi:hypothetical protein
MANITLSIPEELHQVVKEHNEIKWSEIARRAMWEQAMKLVLMDKLVAGSTLREADVDGLDHQVKAKILKHYMK